MQIHRDLVQGTEEWFEVRKLKLTASNATAIGSAGAGLVTLVNKLVIDHIAPDDTPQWKGADIERGNELEPLARLSYEFIKGVRLTEVGFIEYDKHVGASPDGCLFREDGETILGGVEIKARNNAKHYDLLKTGKLESGVVWQMQMTMLCSGADWWDFVSYNPNFKQSTYIQRVLPDPVKFSKLKVGFELGKRLLLQELESAVVKAEL